MKLRRLLAVIMGVAFAAAVLPALMSVPDAAFAGTSPMPTFTWTPMPTDTPTPVPPTNTPTPVSRVACEQLVAIARLELKGVTIGGKNAAKTRTFLGRKLDDASTKLDEGKFDGALGKLEGFRAKVLDLVDAGEMSQTDAALLVGDVDTAISCVEGLN
jgi:hypothetical protein